MMETTRYAARKGDKSMREYAAMGGAVAGPHAHSGVIRPAVPGDAEAIAAVHLATWRDAYAGILPADFLDALRVNEFAQRWRAGERPEAGDEDAHGAIARVFRQSSRPPWPAPGGRPRHRLRSAATRL